MSMPWTEIGRRLKKLLASLGRSRLLRDPKQEAVPHPFHIHHRRLSDRRHGPAGYACHTGFKPWLRDEFDFRCVFCMDRERWRSDGESSLSVEHLLPQSTDSSKALDYSNLAYACLLCNSSRRDTPLPELETAQLAAHLLFNALTGEIVGQTRYGSMLVRAYQLNTSKRVKFRYDRVVDWSICNDPQYRDDPRIGELKRRFEYPESLPNLRRLRPPDSNTRPEGIEQCAFERRFRGQLSRYY